jgi:hypothetical protein
MGTFQGSHPRAPRLQAKFNPATFARNLLHRSLGRSEAPPERATAEQRDAVRQALEAFVLAFSAVKKGNGSADELRKTRADLLRALGESLAIATAVPLLQGFLRGAAIELEAALAAGIVDPALLDRHTHALQAALDQARPVLETGASQPKAFWEASI